MYTTIVDLVTVIYANCFLTVYDALMIVWYMGHSYLQCC